MAEMMAKGNHPTHTLIDAYDQWSDGGWGSILTGKYPRVKKLTVNLSFILMQADDI